MTSTDKKRIVRLVVLHFEDQKGTTNFIPRSLEIQLKAPLTELNFRPVSASETEDELTFTYIFESDKFDLTLHVSYEIIESENRSLWEARIPSQEDLALVLIDVEMDETSQGGIDIYRYFAGDRKIPEDRLYFLTAQAEVVVKQLKWDEGDQRLKRKPSNNTEIKRLLIEMITAATKRRM